MDNSINEIARLAEQAETIQWLLAALVAVNLVFLLLFCVGLWLYFYSGRNLVEPLGAEDFHLQAEDLLARNAIQGLLEFCEKRLVTHPNDVWAHWYLGQAYYHTGAWHASKRSFEKVLDIEPGWIDPVEDWLERLSSRINESGPKLV